VARFGKLDALAHTVGGFAGGQSRCMTSAGTTTSNGRGMADR
jgi:hypothetical protein